MSHLARDAEEAIAELQAAGGCAEDADADRLGAMPEQGDSLDDAKGMAAIMPTGKVGPVSTGARPVPTLGKTRSFAYSPLPVLRERGWG